VCGCTQSRPLLAAGQPPNHPSAAPASPPTERAPCHPHPPPNTGIPTGTLKLLYEEIFALAKAEGKETVTFGFSPFFNLQTTPFFGAYWVELASRFLFTFGNNLYQFKNLAFSKARWVSVWLVCWLLRRDSGRRLVSQQLRSRVLWGCAADCAAGSRHSKPGFASSVRNSPPPHSPHQPTATPPGTVAPSSATATRTRPSP
jgi:hypothetical protein